VFEFICDRIVPGCTHKETGDTPEAVREKAVQHLHDHHGMDYIDNPGARDLEMGIGRVFNS
jgi:predicted small metal-binding protein